MTSRSILTAALLLVGTIAAGQTLPFGRYTVNDGLVDPVIFAIEQDSRHFLWIGTRGGLNRFDGVEYISYNEADGLAHYVIRDLYTAGDGTLWVATERGLSRFDGERFVSFGAEDGLPHPSVRAVIEDRDGMIWVATHGGGVARLVDGAFEVFTTANGLALDTVRCAVSTASGALWFGTSGGGLSRFENGVFTTFAEAEGLGNLEVRALWADEDGTLWVGTRRGLYRGHDGHFEPVVDELFGTTVNDILRAVDGRLWIATRGLGAVTFDGTHASLYGVEQGLADDSVVVLYQDHEDSLWFGSYGRGLSRLSTESILNYEAQPGFTYTNVYCLLEDSRGRLWFGTNGGGLSKLEDGRFTSFTTADGLIHDNVITALETADGTLWFGTLEGVSRYVDGRFQNITTDDGLSHETVFDITEDRHGRLWIGTFDGLTVIEHGRYSVLSVVDGLPDSRVNHVLEARDGTLWVATAIGFARMDGDGRFTPFGVEDGLVSAFVSSIFEDDDGSLWLSTPGGLSHFADGQFTNYTTAEGLSHDMCSVALRGSDGGLWVGTNHGVSRYDGNAFSVVTSKDGLVGDLINRSAAIVDQRGHLWFGTSQGVSMIRGDYASPRSEAPSVYLEAVRIADQPVPLTGEVVLKHDQGPLTFDFVGLSFRRAPEVEYRYRLEGVDRHWHTSRSRSVRYAALPAGDYVFQVTARTSVGGWNEHLASFAFRVIPPVWERPWFVALIASLVVGAILWRVWDLKRHASILEARVSERTAEVEEMNQELRWLAMNDRLTNLRNRHFIYEIMPEEMSRLDRRLGTTRDQGSRLGLAILDLDDFKAVNDSYDHTVGDEVLRAVAESLRTATRETDVVARWGGEEFLILFRDLDEGRLETLVNRVVDQIRHSEIVVSEGIRVSITCSAGYAAFPAVLNVDDYGWDDILRTADVALLEAKRRGRDQSVGVAWKPGIDPEVLATALTTAPRTALENGTLEWLPPQE